MRKNKLDVEEIRSIKNYVGVKSVNFDEALDDFCNDRKRAGVRDSTITYYRREISILRRFIIREKDHVITIADIDKELLDNFVDYLKNERSNSIGGINAKVRAIRTFLFYCEKVGYITNNPAKDWKQIRRKEPEINTFTMRQIHALLKQADRRKFTGLRDYVLMLFLLDTGVRISEALGVTIDDVIFAENRVYIRNTKTDLSRYVPISDRLKQELRQYMRIQEGMSDYLFTNLQGVPIDKNSFRLIINNYGKQAGIKGVRCSPHTFRHTFAKFYILNGGDAFSLMQILGHTTMDMTKRYVRLFNTDIITKHRKYSPLQNL